MVKIFSLKGPWLPVLCLSCNLQVSEKSEGLIDTGRTAAFADTARTNAIADTSQGRDTIAQAANNGLTDPPTITPTTTVNTKNVSPQEVVQFAKTQIGVPYVYGSTNPAVGFDCSGFITYVFNHFGIGVPRSSIDFTHVGQEVSESAALPGDLILFTGTNPAEKHVGHMGIVVSSAPDSLRFIHATSGKAASVTITPLNVYYQKRYVKTVRIFPQNAH